MKVAVFGLGYVGSVTAACLAKAGHQVVGVDPNAEKVRRVASGIAPVREPGLDDLLRTAIESGAMVATTDSTAAVDATDIAIVCVGTPSDSDGSLLLDHIRSVATDIGTAIRDRPSMYTVILRSTVLPGTTRQVLIPAIEAASGKEVGVDFDVCFNPEFLREGTSIDDYYQPPKIVVGTEDGKPNDIANTLYQEIASPRFDTIYEVAEMAKYVDNAWHAVKVTFANEVGRLSHDLDIDGRDVMKIMTADTKLNISPRYLRPGFAYGGSCLPKDVSALNFHARNKGVDLPLLSSLPASNDRQVQSAVELVERIGGRRVGLLGLTFKPDTDDLRNSPFVLLARGLLDLGFEIRIFDPNLDATDLLGANRDFVESTLPELVDLLVGSASEVVDFADTIILSKNESPLTEAASDQRDGQTLLDLAGMADQPTRGTYVGIAW